MLFAGSFSVLLNTSTCEGLSDGAAQVEAAVIDMVRGKMDMRSERKSCW